MTYPEFAARWQPSGRGRAGQLRPVSHRPDLCDLLGVPRPNATTDNPAQDAYVLERAVSFDDGAGKKSTGCIDLYKRGCFVLETKQGTDLAARTELAQLGLPAEKHCKGHAQRNTPKWRQMMEAARQQALGYVRALPAAEPRPLFVMVADVGYCLDPCSNLAGVGDSFVPFPDSQGGRQPLAALAH